jgi:membrane protease YdiL (CAAX protease family)
MNEILLVFMLLVVFWDVKILKGFHLELFFKHFHFSWRLTAILGVVLISFFGLAFNPQGKFSFQDFLAIVIVLEVIPVYLFKRGRFMREYLPAHPSARASSSFAMSDAFAIILSWFMSLVIFTALIEGLIEDVWGAHSSELLELLLTALFSFSILLILIYRTTQRTSSQTFFQNLSLTWENQSWVKMVLFPAMLGIFFAAISAYVVFVRDVQPPTPLSNVLDETHSSLVLGLFIVLALLVAPFLEEMIFRGYFFNVLRLFKGERLAIYIVSLSFAFLHVGQYWGDWMAIGMVTVLGFVLTLVRVWTQTTIASSIMHYCYNIGVTIIPLVALSIANPAFFEYQVYSATYDAPKKIELLKESIRLQPDLAEAYNELAWLYAEQNQNLEEALESANHALHFSPQSRAFLDTQAEVLTKLKRFDEALVIRQELQDKGDADQIEKICDLRVLMEE